MMLEVSQVVAWLSGSTLGLDQRSHFTSGSVNTWTGDSSMGKPS